MPRPIRQEIVAVDKTQAAFRSVTGSINRLSASFGALVGVGSFGLLTRQAITAAAEIQNVSKRLGASVEALSGYRYAAEQTGVSIQTLELGWQRMTRRISEAAAGTGEAKAALIELGLSATALNRLSPDKQFEAIADAIAGVGNQADKVRLAMKLFDSEGVSLLQTMEGGASAMRKWVEDGRRAGAVITDEMAASAEEAQRSLKRMEVAFISIGSAIIEVAEPAISAFASTLSTIAEFLRNSIPDFRDLARAIESINGPYARLNSLEAERLELQQKLLAVESRGRGPSGAAAEIREQIGLVNEQIASVHALIRMREQMIESEPEVSPIPTIRISGGVQLDAYDESLKKLAADLKKDYSALEQLQDKLLDIEELWKRGAIGPEIYSRAVTDVNAKIEAELDKLKGKTAEATNQWSEFGQIITSAFEDAIASGAKFSDVLDGLIADLARLITRMSITRPLTTAIEQFDWGKLASTILEGRAIGGPVRKDQPYIVGEKGAEVFVPDAAGSIIPNSKLASGSDLFGGGDVSVSVIVENHGQPLAVKGTETTQGPDGRQQIKIMVENAVNSMIGEGRLDRAMRSNFGLSRLGVAR